MKNETLWNKICKKVLDEGDAMAAIELGKLMIEKDRPIQQIQQIHSFPSQKQSPTIIEKNITYRTYTKNSDIMEVIEKITENGAKITMDNIGDMSECSTHIYGLIDEKGEYKVKNKEEDLNKEPKRSNPKNTRLHFKTMWMRYEGVNKDTEVLKLDDTYLLYTSFEGVTYFHIAIVTKAKAPSTSVTIPTKTESKNESLGCYEFAEDEE